MQYSKVADGRRGRAMRTVLAGALVGGRPAIGASPAAASDDTPFQGFRIEAITGYDDVGVDFDDDVYHGGKNSQSGFIDGLGGGYDFKAGSLVFSVEG